MVASASGRQTTATTTDSTNSNKAGGAMFEKVNENGPYPNLLGVRFQRQRDLAEKVS